MAPEVLTWNELVRHAGSPARARSLVQHREWWQVCRGAYAPWHVEDGPAVRGLALRRGPGTRRRACCGTAGPPDLGHEQALLAVRPGVSAARRA